jgi:NAD(P)H-dependent FMN reductase
MRLLVVHHTTSPALQQLLEAVLTGARDPDAGGAEVDVQPALGATVSDVLAADGFLLGTPANIGYMSGALKHFFDTVYYPCLDATRGRPYALWVHGNDDTAGAIRGVETITTGLGWRRLRPALSLVGAPDKDATEACWDLGATAAAALADNDPS